VDELEMQPKEILKKYFLDAQLYPALDTTKRG
jgi:hypothetical protein